jgi:hypothetical protein
MDQRCKCRKAAPKVIEENLCPFLYSLGVAKLI